jgi:phosphonatase-like hydrolase
MTELVVFDMAGTTVEDKQNVAEALQNALSAYDCHVNIEEINLLMGYPKPVAIQNLLAQYAGPDAAHNEALVHNIHDLFVQEIIRFYNEHEDIKEKDNAASVFVQLRQMGIKVALDTGFSRAIADVIINRLGWQKDVHFDVSITSDEVERGRPFPDMIYKAMQLLNIESVAAVVKVGDTISDLQEGNAAGCTYVIGITTGAYTEKELALEKHTHLISDLKEVIAIVSGIHPN